MKLRFNKWDDDGFSVLADLTGPTLIDSDRIIGLFLVVDPNTREILGFECGHPDEDYDLIMSELERNPIPDLFDVPDLGLKQATIKEIVMTAVMSGLRESSATAPPPPRSR